MNKEELIEIGQEKIDKAVDTFQSKAIDVLEFLTWQFKNDFATDIDNNLNGYKRDFDKLQIEYSERDMLNICLLNNNNQIITLQQDTKIQSIEQHEEEIRKQERQKVIAELEEWVYNNWYYTWEKENRYDDEEDEVPIHKDLDVKSEDLRQKLTELKATSSTIN